jgi:hypothetical protein
MSTPFAAESLWLPSFAAVYGFSEDRSKEKAPQRGAGQFDRKHVRVVLRSDGQASYGRLAAIAAPVKECHPHLSPSHVRVKHQMAASLSICTMAAVTARIVHGVRSLRSTGSHRCGYTANAFTSSHGIAMELNKRGADWPRDGNRSTPNLKPSTSLAMVSAANEIIRSESSRSNQ